MPLSHATALVAVMLIVLLCAGYAASEQRNEPPASQPSLEQQP
jgi:hypothetical protein